MTQHKRCRQCQQFFRPDDHCFRCSTVEWLLSLSRWQRLQIIWFLLHPPAAEKVKEEDYEKNTAADTHPPQNGASASSASSRTSAAATSPKGDSHVNTNSGS